MDRWADKVFLRDKHIDNRRPIHSTPPVPLQSRVETKSANAIDEFLKHRQKVTADASFLRDSLRNADVAAARRSVILLRAVATALDSLDDTYLNSEDIITAQQAVLRNLIPLERFIERAEAAQVNAHRRVVYTGSRGRPPLDLDLNAAIELHDVGNS